MCYLSESFCLFARSLAFMLLVIKENGVNDVKNLPPVGQSLLTRTSSLWFPDPGPLSQCLPPLTEHTKYLTVSSLPISIVCGPSSISFSLLMAFICVCHKYYNIIIINNKHSYINDIYINGHLAILKLLLAHLLHIVITAICVGVVKIDGMACRGQYLKGSTNTSIVARVFDVSRVLPGATQI